MSKRLRIAVTGGSGRIGQAVVKELVSRGHSVINIDRRPPEDRSVKFHFIDIRSREQLQPVLEGMDAVAHLAENPNPHALISGDELFTSNTRCAATVLQTAADLGIGRVIYTSSCQVYGSWGDVLANPAGMLPMDETTPVNPQNHYALGKVVGEQYARFLGEKAGLSVAIFRLPWVIQDEHVLRHLDYRSHGHFEGFCTYVGTIDTARAFALAIENPRPGCEAYHFTADEILSLAPLRERLKFMNWEDLLPADWPAFRSPVLTNKAREHFGWKPEINALEAYRQRHGGLPGQSAA
jgi:nucleoside-diphosphate-sugar epimerase